MHSIQGAWFISMHVLKLTTKQTSINCLFVGYLPLFSLWFMMLVFVSLCDMYMCLDKVSNSLLSYCDCFDRHIV